MVLKPFLQYILKLAKRVADRAGKNRRNPPTEPHGFICNRTIFLAMGLFCLCDEFPAAGNSGNFLSEPQVRSPVRRSWTLRI
jgi:hypothetical protein